LLPSDDTYLDQSKPNDTSLGQKATIDIRPDNAADLRGLLRFDLSAIPANATITSATLYLYEKDNKNGVIAYIYRVTSSWTELTASWNSPWGTAGGDFNLTSYGSFLAEQKDCMASLNLKNLVQDWVNQKYPNYGLMLYMTGSNHKFTFVSKEEPGNLEERPRLSISYTVAYRPNFLDILSSLFFPNLNKPQQPIKVFTISGSQ